MPFITPCSEETGPGQPSRHQRRPPLARLSRKCTALGPSFTSLGLPVARDPGVCEHGHPPHVTQTRNTNEQKHARERGEQVSSSMWNEQTSTGAQRSHRRHERNRREDTPNETNERVKTTGFQKFGKLRRPCFKLVRRSSLPIQGELEWHGFH